MDLRSSSTVASSSSIGIGWSSSTCAGFRSPPSSQPPGVEITSLAVPPDLLTGVHAVAELAFPDIPHTDEQMQAGSLEEFRKRDVDRPGMPRDAFYVALDGATGEVIGYASLFACPVALTRHGTT